jgi:hypothetical protein
VRYPVGAEGKAIEAIVGASAIYEGIMVAQLDADATIVPCSTALSGDCIGVSTHYAAAGAYLMIETDRQYLFANATAGDACSAATPIGWTVYAYDDHTIADNDAGGTRAKAGIFLGMEGTKVKVHITPSSVTAATAATDVTISDSGNYFDTDTVEAALQQVIADLALTTATHGANMIGYQDSGNKTAAATADAALDEIYVDALTASAQHDIPIGAFVLAADGAPLAVWSAANDGTCGTYCDGTKALGIRWNNTAATCVAVAAQLKVPADLNTAVAPTIKIKCAKIGATAGDTPTITVGCYAQTEAAAYDAGADLGSATAAMANPASKTLQLMSATLSVMPDVASGITITLLPEAAELATDDLLITHVWLEYTRKMRTA